MFPSQPGRKARRPGFSSPSSWPKPYLLNPYILESSDRGTTGSKVKRASLSCPMCVYGGGGGERVRGGGASSARGGLTPRRREISASTAAKHGVLLRGEIPPPLGHHEVYIWGSLTPPVPEQEPGWGNEIDVCQGPTALWHQPSREGQPLPSPPQHKHPAGPRTPPCPPFSAFTGPWKCGDKGVEKVTHEGDVGVLGLYSSQIPLRFETAKI